MEPTRLNKIGRLIQKELSDMFLKQTKNMPGTLISVSTVRVSPDLGLAKAYLSIFPSDKAPELLGIIEARQKTIRYDLGQRVRTQLRKIPELAFYLDDSIDYAEHIDQLLKK
jgi:ribosome-binding factor A